MEPTLELIIKQLEQLFDEKKYQDIIELLTDELLATYNDAFLYRWRARSHGILDETELTFIYAQKSIDLDPSSATGYLLRGSTFLKKKDYDKASVDYTEAIRLDPNKVSAYSGMGNVWFEQKEYDRAIENYTEAIRLNSDKVSTYVNRAMALSQKGEYDKAIDDYNYAIKINPNDANTFLSRGVTYGEKKDYDNAIIDYNEAIRLDPQNILAYNNRSNIWADRGDYDKAIDDLDKAIKLNPKNNLIRNNRGITFLHKGKYDEAIADYTEVIQLEPDNAIAYKGRGDAWTEKKEFSKAVVDYTRAIQLNPNDIDAYNNRGNVWSSLSQHEKAIADYTEAIRLSPNEADFFRNRGNTWIDKREYEKAIADYNEAIRLDPEDERSYVSRGIALSYREEYDKAITDYTKAIKLNAISAEAFYNRGNALSEKREYDKAISDFKRYVELSNDLNSYYAKVASNKIEELTKRIENSWYDEIDSIIDKVKALLLFDSPFLTHYTSLSGARAMILDKSLFRLSEGAFLNDTSEGRELFNYLIFETTERVNSEAMAEIFVERPFIGSFVADSKHNDLTLWRMYGKEAQAEAKGCALTVDKNKFISSLRDKVNSTENKLEIQSHIEEQFTFYNVAYLSKGNFSIPGKSIEIERLLNLLMIELSDKIKLLKLEQKVTVTRLLNSIAYLFKSSEYQYENEVRLVVQGIGFEKRIESKDGIPKVYIELLDITQVLNRITLGPKVERADEWAATFNYYIKEQHKDKKEKVEIIISHLPFK
jgi:tetratricopeptide (TPR) repeat protein